MKAFLKSHKRLIMLKGVIACALILTHYFPDNKASLIVNLIWLTLF